MKKNIIIMGAAGRDYHNFNMHFRDNKNYKVVAFTHAQIPYIVNKFYPKVLAGRLYPKGIPIFPEKMLPKLIEKYKVDGILYHDAKTCPNNSNSRYEMPQRLGQRLGKPYLMINGDLNDLRLFSEEQTRTNLEAFAEQLLQA